MNVPKDSRLPILSVIECDPSGAFFRNIGKTPWQSCDDRPLLASLLAFLNPGGVEVAKDELLLGAVPRTRHSIFEASLDRPASQGRTVGMR